MGRLDWGSMACRAASPYPETVLEAFEAKHAAVRMPPRGQPPNAPQLRSRSPSLTPVPEQALVVLDSDNSDKNVTDQTMDEDAPMPPTPCLIGLGLSNLTLSSSSSSAAAAAAATTTTKKATTRKNTTAVAAAKKNVSDEMTFAMKTEPMPELALPRSTASPVSLASPMHMATLVDDDDDNDDDDATAHTAAMEPPFCSLSSPLLQVAALAPPIGASSDHPLLFSPISISSPACNDLLTACSPHPGILSSSAMETMTPATAAAAAPAEVACPMPSRKRDRFSSFHEPSPVARPLSGCATIFGPSRYKRKTDIMIYT